MSKFRIAFNVCLVALGLFSMIVLGGNNFQRWQARLDCSGTFVEHDTWNWECR